MASLVLIAVFVSVFAGMFLTIVYMVYVAERERYPVAQPIARTAPQRAPQQRRTPYPVATGVVGTPRAVVSRAVH